MAFCVKGGLKMKKNVVLLLFILAVQVIFADTIWGKITDSKTQEPIVSVGITIDQAEKLAYSDEEGKFLFRDIPAGDYELNFKRIGYQEKTIAITVPLESSLNIQLIPKPTRQAGIKVAATRAKPRETPVTFSNLSKNEIQKSNYGQDLPLLIDEMPNVYAYSDAGSGMGYSYLKVRGFDQKHIGVMINGIPLNDPEDHQVYWIDMPDLAESIDNIQFQRGVGSSLYGVSAFGGSLNLQTSSFQQKDKFELFSNYGSYNSYKVGAKFNYNLSPKWNLNLRLSKMESDGYRDNSASELWSYFTNITRKSEHSLTELNFYGGNELTHAAWDASSEADLQENHQHNPITYKNEIDDFDQPHLELHQSYQLNSKLNLDNSLFYIKGKGYYEQLEDDEDLWEYGLCSEPDSLESDLVRQKWVEKNQYGWVGRMNWQHRQGELTLGSYLSLFDSDHWGKVEKLLNPPAAVEDFQPGQHYYNYTGDKKYLTFFANEEYKLNPKLNLMLNLYYQYITYEFQQKEEGNFSGALLNSYEVDYSFFNPRFGVNYNLNENWNIYGNISQAQREPTDDELSDTWDGPDDLGVQPLFSTVDTVYTASGQIDHLKWQDPQVKPEKLIDYELGFGYQTPDLLFKVNLFWMNFRDEIVPYGTVDDDSQPIRGNADKTVHRGIELSLNSYLPYNLAFSGNFSYNDNYFEEFTMYDWDENGNTVALDFSGNQITGFPNILSSGKLSYLGSNFETGLQLQYVGKQYLDNTENDNRVVDPYTLVNFNFNYDLTQLFDLANVTLTLHANNLLDKEYETSGYYDAWAQENYYYPGPGRNFMAGLRMSF
jgi:iron complex outermembrane receptor protein